NALTYGVAGELPFSWLGQRLTALATLAGEVELQQGGAVERPMELLAALRWQLPGNLQFTFGGGPGLTNGYGTPRYRVFAGIGFDPARAVRRARPRQPIRVLRDTPEIRKVRIEGHTDGRGKPAYNRRLSQRRAESVLRHLAAAGIDASRLRVKGFGADRPLAPNDTGANRAKNRRVEFIVL